MCACFPQQVLLASSCTLACMNHFVSLRQSQKWMLPSGWVVKWDLKSLDTAREWFCLEWTVVSIALLAAGRLSVKTTILLHPVAMVLVMVSRMAKSSASVDVALAEGYSLPAMIFSQDDVTCDARQKPC